LRVSKRILKFNYQFYFPILSAIKLSIFSENKGIKLCWGGKEEINLIINPWD